MPNHRLIQELCAAQLALIEADLGIHDTARRRSGADRLRHSVPRQSGFERCEGFPGLRPRTLVQIQFFVARLLNLPMLDEPEPSVHPSASDRSFPFCHGPARGGSGLTSGTRTIPQPGPNWLRLKATGSLEPPNRGPSVRTGLLDYTLHGAQKKWPGRGPGRGRHQIDAGQYITRLRGYSLLSSSLSLPQFWSIRRFSLAIRSSAFPRRWAYSLACGRDDDRGDSMAIFSAG